MDTNNSGIYKITNSVNGKVYIGSTVDLKRRKRVHFRDLRVGQHYNTHLQRAYNKYGASNFHWDVLEYINTNPALVKREEYWITIYNSLLPKHGYNCGYADRHQPFDGTGKISKGEKNHRSVSYELIDLYSSERHIGKCVAKFARDNNLKACGYFNMMGGITNTWGKRFTTQNILEKMPFYTFIHTDGKIVRHFSLKEISKQLGLRIQKLSNVNCGNASHHKGWMKYINQDLPRKVIL